MSLTNDEIFKIATSSAKDFKNKHDELILSLKMQYGTKWNEEFRRMEADRQQKEVERKNG